MKKHILYFVICFSVASCQSNQSTDNETDKTAVDTTSVQNSKQNCYLFTKNKDTATLTIIQSNRIISGQLSYHLYEKDRNQGIIKGAMRGDTLLADYTFNSEGQESVRQVAFLKKGNQFLEGFGDVEEMNGKTVFKNLKHLKFGDAVTFEKIDCN
jgi:uncharacterized protein YcfL